MRVLVVNSFFFPNEIGGAEKSVRITSSELVGLGHEVQVVALGPDFQDSAVDGINVRNVPISNVYLPSGKAENRPAASKLTWHVLDTYNPSMSAKLDRIVREFKPDVIHTNNLSGFSVSVWLTARKNRIPVVHTTRDFYLICPKGTMIKGGASCATQCRTCTAYSLPRRYASRFVSHVVGISDFILQRHLKYGFFDGVDSSVIYNPYLPGTGLFDNELGYKASKPSWRLGFIGRLDPVKGVEVLIDACKALVDGGVDIELSIAGEGNESYEATIRQRSSGLGGRVALLGKVEASSFYRDIDLLVVPSVWDEPLGRIVLEAFAHGLPVVSTPVGGLPEVTTGFAGFVSESVSAAALVTSIREALDRIQRYPEEVREAAIQESRKYEPPAIARAYQAVYTNAVEAYRG